MLLSSHLSSSFYKGTNPITWASLVAQLIKKSTCNVGDLGLIPGLGRSPGEGNRYSLQYSGLENSMDYIVHGVEKSQTRLSNFYFNTSHHRDPLHIMLHSSMLIPKLNWVAYTKTLQIFTHQSYLNKMFFKKFKMSQGKMPMIYLKKASKQRLWEYGSLWFYTYVHMNRWYSLIVL